MRPARIVVVGDLNGAEAVLREVLVGTGLIAMKGDKARWIGGRSRLVQMGDIFNRGDGARDALKLLLGLQGQARRVGGAVHIILGNHEVMTALRNEAYCTEGEYLSFATPAERRSWPTRVHRAMRRLYRSAGGTRPIRPLVPRLEAWKIEHVPGQAALRRELGRRGRLGQAVRRMPVAIDLDGHVFSHAGLTPEWARRGVDGVNRVAALLWRDAPRHYEELPRHTLFRDSDGPLWNRWLAVESGARVDRALRSSLEMLSARRMIVGHTHTHRVPGGSFGMIATRCASRLVCVDVGLSSAEEGPRAVLVIEGGLGYEWTPDGTRVLWRDR